MSGDTAHAVEPMDIDCIDSEFDNKENTFSHNSMLPCTEKGYEELDVSELNMKLRYSITPTASPMSKSFTNCTDHRSLNSDDTLNIHNEPNLTRSLNSMLTKNDNLINSLKTLPLQSISTDKNNSVLMQLDSKTGTDCADITLTVTVAGDLDENISLSSTSSAVQTPEATTPTKDLKADGGSPIMRGLKSVLNMFRSSQSPIQPVESNPTVIKCETLNSETVIAKPEDSLNYKQAAQSSTPIPTQKQKESNGSKRCSPYKESIVFNDDLEKELQWKEETTIIFSQEKIPVHKLFFQQTRTSPKTETNEVITSDKLNAAVEYMDISYNDSRINDKILTDNPGDIIKTEYNSVCNDSDSEFLDCESFVKNESQIIENEEHNLNKEQINSSLGVKNLNDIVLDDNRDDIDNKLEIVGKMIPAESIPKMVLNETVNIMIDSLDIDVTNEIPVTDSQTVESIILQNTLSNNNNRCDEFSNSSLTVQSDNINENNISLPNNGLVNNMCLDYELDSLECNVKPPTSYKDVSSKSNDVDANINEFHTLDSNRTVDILVQNDNFMSLSKVQLPDVDNNEKEQNITVLQDVVLNNSLSDVTEKNIKAHNDFNKSIEVPLGVACNDVIFEKTLSIDTAIISTKNKQVNDISHIPTIIADTKEEINISPEKNQQSKIDNVSLQEINTTHQSITQIEQDEVLLPNDGEVAIEIESNNVDIEFLNNDHCINNCLNIDINTITLNETQNLHEIVTSSSHSSEKALEELQDIQTELNSTNVTNVNEMSKPMNDSVILSGVNKTLESITEDQARSNSLILKEQSITLGCVNEEKEIILKSVSPLEIPIINDIKDNKTAFDANKKLSEEIENKEKSIKIPDDTETQTLVDRINENITQNIEFQQDNESCTIKSNCDDTKDCATIISNMLEGNPNSQNLLIQSPDKSFANKNNFSEEQTIVSDKLQLDNEMQNDRENKNLNATLEEEVGLNKIIKSEATLKNMYTEIQDSVHKDMIPKIDATNFDTNSTIKVVSNKEHIDISGLKQNETINANPTLNENLTTDDLSLASNSANNDVVVCDLDTFTLDEEIVLSENNSPYVSVSEDLDRVSVEHTSESSALIEEMNTPTPISNSPPIRSKGYNFNFDEIDDPFATKTTIQITPETMNKNIKSKHSVEVEKIKISEKIISTDRRKSQYERKRQNNVNKKLNKTVGCETTETLTTYDNFDCNYLADTKNNANNNQEKSTEELTNNQMIEETLESATFINTNTLSMSNRCDNDVSMLDNICTNIILHSQEKNESSTEETGDVSCADHKNTSSSDQSSYYSAGTSSGESIKPRNVFNLPEIDDINFNPFAVKSKIWQSPPPSISDDNSSVMKSKLLGPPENCISFHNHIESQNSICTNFEEHTMKECEDKMDTELMEKDTTVNLSTDTYSEKDTTVRQINTEDEDTIEGPFLEVEDFTSEKTCSLAGENIDMMQFNDIPTKDKEDNAEGELFIDAEAFEFLLNKNKNVVSDSGKESLFLKFDPLFAKLSSDSFLSGNRRQSTPRKFTKQVNIHSTASPSSLNITYEKDANNITGVSTEDASVIVSKPMMVVPPALNATPRKSLTPTRTNRHSVVFTSPAMAVIDRLLSLSTNDSLVEHETTFAQVSHEQNEADLALTQLRELLAEKEIYVYNLRSESKELKERFSVLESRMNSLETESQQRLKKINELMETVSEKTKENRSMAAVVEEYERTIASLIADTEQDKKRHADERIALIHERDEQTAHLASMEVSFNDLHSKYEKSKQIIFSYEANKESYKKSLMAFEENVTKVQNNYELLKQHATSKLNHANEELQKINRAHEAEVLKLNAMIKRKDLHITSLEETLAQKTKANEELTAICDELINKVG